MAALLLPYRWPIKPQPGVSRVAHFTRQGLYLDWPLLEGGGGLVRDLAGNKPGTWNAYSSALATWVPTPMGPGVSFSNTTFQVAGSNATKESQEFWIQVNPSNITSDPLGIMTNGLSTDTTEEREVFIDAAGKFGIRIFDGASKTATSTTVVAGGQVYHVVWTADGSNLRMYVNGINEGTTAAGAPYTGYTTPNLFIGAGRVSAGAFVAGHQTIIMFRRWTSALTAAEVQQLYRHPFAAYTVPLLPRRLFVPGTGTQSYSYTGAGGAQTGGTATRLRDVVFAPSGGAVSGGSAARATGKTVVPSGGALSGGSASFNRKAVETPSGGATTGGSAGKATGKTVTPSGGAHSGGTAPENTKRITTPSGGAQSGGTAAFAKGEVVAPSGGATSSGTASFNRKAVFTPAGGLASGGTAGEATGYGFLPSGGAHTSGAATFRRTVVFQPSGGAHTGGAALTNIAAPAVEPEIEARHPGGGSGGTRRRRGIRGLLDRFRPPVEEELLPPPAQVAAFVASGGISLGGGAAVDVLKLQRYVYTVRPEGAYSGGKAEIRSSHPARDMQIMIEDAVLLLK